MERPNSSEQAGMRPDVVLQAAHPLHLLERHMEERETETETYQGIYKRSIPATPTTLSVCDSASTAARADLAELSEALLKLQQLGTSASPI
jgi:hypothetical protein